MYILVATKISFFFFSTSTLTNFSSTLWASFFLGPSGRAQHRAIPRWASTDLEEKEETSKWGQGWSSLEVGNVSWQAPVLEICPANSTVKNVLCFLELVQQADGTQWLDKQVLNQSYNPYWCAGEWSAHKIRWNVSVQKWASLLFCRLPLCLKYKLNKKNLIR